MTHRCTAHPGRGGPFAVRPGSVFVAAVLVAVGCGLMSTAVTAAAARRPARAAGACCARGLLGDSLDAAVLGMSDHAQVAALAVSLDRGDTLLALNEDRRMIPGSNTKIFTTSAFLRRYGPDARFLTRIEARGTVDRKRQGTFELKGDLVLRPSGVPDVIQILAPGSRGLLDSLASLVRASGLRRFEGTLWVDGTLFAEEPFAPGWAIEDVGAAYGAVTGPVLANGNAATLVMVGEPNRVRVALEPPETPLEIESRLRVARPGNAGWIDLDRRAGSRSLRVRGEVAPGDTVRKQVSVPDPDSTAGLWLLAALRREGIETKAVVRLVPHRAPIQSGDVAPSAASRGPEPPPAEDGATDWSSVKKNRTAVVVGLESPSAAAFVGVVHALSLNAEAEGLLRMLDPSPREKRRSGGLAEVRRLAAEAGIDTLDLSLVDGSGLSPMNLATARALVAWLAAHARDSLLAVPFRVGLAAPGALGTLKQRFAGLDPRADLRAKTGTLTNVSSLAGYVTDADGDRLAFAVLTNGNRSRVAPSRQMEERIVGMLADYHRAKSAPAKAPRKRR